MECGKNGRKWKKKRERVGWERTKEKVKEGEGAVGGEAREEKGGSRTQNFE